MRLIKHGFSLGIVVLTLIFSSCSKEKGIENENPNPGGDTASLATRIKDTTLWISQDIYLWYNQIPNNFNPRGYSDPNAIMEALRAYSMEPGFTQPVDRWSFAVKQSVWDDVSGGIAQDFGLNIFFLQDGDLRVRAVEENSPAGKAGIRRGWRIRKINSSTNITYNNADFIVQNVYYSPTTVFQFEKPDGTTADITLNAASYQENPVYLDTVYTVNAAKVGYLVFNSFLGDTTAINNRFAEVFSDFSQKGVTDVIVDLRYNGGGYVSVQDKLANYLVKSSANGDVMMNQAFNDKYSMYNSTTKFEKLGNLNLNRIFFIVSENTASASELLINNLKPYMDVKIVGPSASYGKPVGYFNIPVGDWYIFPVSFRSTNKNNSGNYFDGFIPEKQVADGIDKDWGDITESALASIVRYVGTGSFGYVGERPGSVREETRDSRIKEINRKFEVRQFKGMVDTRKKF